MRAYRYRLVSLILVFFFVFFLIFAAIALYTSYSTYLSARGQVLESKKSNLEFFVNQYDYNLANVRNGLVNILYNDVSNIVAFQKDTEDTQYKRAKYDLNDQLKEYVEVFPFIYGFYVKVGREKDTFIVSADTGTAAGMERKETLIEMIWESDGYTKPDFLNYNGQKFLVYGIRNLYMEAGFLIAVDQMEAQFFGDYQGGEYLQLMLWEEDIKETGAVGYHISDREYVFERLFEELDVIISLYVPQDEIEARISPFQKMWKPIAVLILILLPVVYLGFWKFFISPMNKLSGAMQKIMSGKQSYRIQTYSRAQEFYEIEHAFNEMLDHNENLKNEAYELELEKKQQQLQNLQLQINPHLLLNSLNTIYNLAQNKKTEEVQGFALNLSKYFRYVLRDITEFVTIRSEMEFISSYIKVQKVRYPDRFYVMFDVAEDLMEQLIPPLIIQNFLENSTKYALKADEEIEVLIIIREYGSKLRISICDNGKGMESELVEKIRNGEIIYDSRGKHVGIWNCIRRLRAVYGESVLFTITSELGSGTQVWIEIPKDSGNMEVGI